MDRSPFSPEETLRPSLLIGFSPPHTTLSLPGGATAIEARPSGDSGSTDVKDLLVLFGWAIVRVVANVFVFTDPEVSVGIPYLANIKLCVPLRRASRHETRARD